MAIPVRNDKNGQVTVPEVSESSIGECSLAIVDASGPDGLTVAAIAASLGVRATDISPFAAGPGDLLDLACDQIYGQIDLDSESESWAERFRHYARSFRGCLLNHPRALVPMATRPILHESSMKVAEKALTELTAVGFDPQSANRVLIVIVSFVLGHTLTEVGPTREIVYGGEEVDNDRVQGFRQSLPSDSLPISAEALARENDRDAEFELGLKLIVDGLERQLLHA